MMTARLAFPGEGPPKSGRRLTDDLRPEDCRLTWYVLRSATRREKDAEKGLIEAGFVVYLPREVRVRRRAGRKFNINGPLLPGYLFVGLDEGQSLYHATNVDAVHDVVRSRRDFHPRSIPFGGGEGTPGDFLEREQGGEFDRSSRAKREPPAKGDAITVDGGQFQGFPARFVELRPGDRVRLAVEMFGRWTEISLKRDAVEQLREDEA
jgi:transcriptional antiterminator RfaH